MVKSLKILTCGDVCGQFAAWLKRLETVNKKAGPFEMCLCVGSFFASGTKEPDPKDAELWEKIKTKKITPPMTVYILGPNLQSEKQFYSDLNGYEIADNVIYLGQHGCLTTQEGLKIAYASGAGSEANANGFQYEQFKVMETQLKWNDSNFNGVDILITSEWPAGVAKGAGSQPEDLPADASGSRLISKLAMHLRPRYHFSGLHGCYYERQPYRNHMVLNEATRHVTRFIAVAKVGNPSKKKWLYAFNIAPMKHMDRTELVAQPPDVTDSPYNPEDFTGFGVEKRSQFFYDMNAPMEDDKKKRKGQKNEQQQGQKRQKQMGPCWFCLSGSEVEKHLIVSIGEHSYLALPKGGLISDHILILPIAHHASLLELPDEVNEEVEKFKSALKKFFKKQNKVVVFFERNYKSFHMQLQVVPLPKECKDSIKSAFMDIADAQNIEMLEMPEHSSLAQMTPPGAPYFYVELPTKEKLFHRVRSGFPIHFGREVLASPGLLNCEEAIDWRDIKSDQETETKLTKDFRTKFAPFDFTLEEEDAA